MNQDLEALMAEYGRPDPESAVLCAVADTLLEGEADPYESGRRQRWYDREHVYEKLEELVLLARHVLEQENLR